MFYVFGYSGWYGESACDVHAVGGYVYHVEGTEIELAYLTQQQQIFNYYERNTSKLSKDVITDEGSCIMYKEARKRNSNFQTDDLQLPAAAAEVMN